MANPLAYWASSSVTKEKSGIILTPGGHAVNDVIGDVLHLETGQTAGPQNFVTPPKLNHLKVFSFLFLCVRLTDMET
jgi:hypothetical protein